MFGKRWKGVMAGILAMTFMLIQFVGITEAEKMENRVFSYVAGRTFTFASGAGGWSTQIILSEDGRFSGYFHDSDMGDIGEGYPEGTLYECVFTGVFTEPDMTDLYTYMLRLAALNVESDTGTEHITDGVKVIYTDAYGIADGDVFMLYLPGRTTAELPEGFLEWICLPNAWEEAPDVLPFFGLYNVKEEVGFFTEPDEGALFHYDDLSGAWRTSEDSELIITLLLYPEDAFRLYIYDQESDETSMLEGIRSVEGNYIVIPDARLGVLDTAGNYTQMADELFMRFRYTLELDSVPTLTLFNDQDEAMIFYPFDPDI
ncbi:MAG: hypothetical protein FWF47_06610 [Clostridia bacterium]|nr:hypothetical protein [Clostridia bacterium]